jgi:hypothetical protein
MLTTVYNVSGHYVKMYVNGIFSVESPANIATPDGSENASMYIGSDNPAVGTSYYLQGSIDDIRIYNRTLSDNEISKLYTRKN